MEIFPALVTVVFPRAFVVNPAGAARVMLPRPAVKVRFPGPSNVFKNVIGWLLFEVFIEHVPEAATGPAKEIIPDLYSLRLKTVKPAPF